MPGKNDSADLTAGSLWENIWRMSWPMLLIMLLNFFVGLTDVYVAGFIGPEVQAAVGFVSQLYFLIIIIANALSIGTVALISRAVGARNEERAVDVARQSLLFSLLIAFVLTLTGNTFAPQIVSFAGFPAEIKEIAVLFLRIFAFALGPNYVLIISNAVFRAGGEVKKMLLTMFLVSCVNVIAVFVLVFGAGLIPAMGYPGIAVATAASLTLGTVVNLVQIGRSRWRNLYDGPRRLSLDTIKDIVNLGWPAAFLQIAWNAGSIVLYNMLGRLGEASITALASITSGLRIEAVIYLPAFAMNMASSVLVGQNLGAGMPRRAQELGWKIASAGVLLVSVMALVIFLLAERLASLVAQDRAVIEETVRYLRINMLSEPFMALSAILGGCLQGAGDTRGTMWVIVISMWFIRLPLAYVLGLMLGYGATGVWVAMIASMTVQGILMTWRFRKGRWREIELG